MKYFLKGRLAVALVVLGVLGYALAACAGTFAPSSWNQGTDRTQGSALTGQAISEPSAAGCPPPYGTYGGTYTILTDAGNVKNGTFTPVLSRSVWERVVYIHGASPAPTIPPHPPIYVYRGTYKDAHNGVTDSVGCAVLFTTQSGKAVPAWGGVNANDSEAPAFRNGVAVKPVLGVGSIKALTITNLSATGGHGSYTLSNGSTGTMTFTLRQSIP